LVTIG